MRGACKALVIASVWMAVACGNDDSEKAGTGGQGGAGAAGGSGTGATGGGGTGGMGAGGIGATGGAGGAGGVTGCSGIPAPPQSGGKIFYVSPAGSDSSPGTQASPFATIQKGVDGVAPGDTVIVMDGTYEAAAGSKLVRVTKGGTATNWVWIRAQNRWGAKLDGQGMAQEAISLADGVGWVRVEGFEIFGFAIDGSTTGITAYSGGHDSEIVGNHIHDIGHICTSTANGLCGIFIQQPNVTVDSNVIHDIGRYADGENGCVTSNDYWQNHDHGIYVDGNAPGASGALIRNNVFYNHARGWAIHLYPGTLDDLRILNNTFEGENPNRDGHIVLDAALSNLRIENNVFDKPRNAALKVYGLSSATNVTVARNLTSVANMLDSATPAGFTLEGNVVGTDPGFVNAAARDFHLAAGSAAVDQGKTVSEVPWDFDGCARPVGASFDIGADER